MKTLKKILVIIMVSSLCLMMFSGCSESGGNGGADKNDHVETENGGPGDAEGSGNNTETQPVSESGWVQVEATYEEANDTDNEYYEIDYSFEGSTGDSVKFKREGGYYKDPENYNNSITYYECQQPPKTLAPGQELTLTMKTSVEEYEFASSDGSKPGIYADQCWLQIAGKHFTDVKDENNTYLTVKTTGDVVESREFTFIIPEEGRSGSRFDIQYCINNTGTYTWTYEYRE